MKRFPWMGVSMVVLGAFAVTARADGPPEMRAQLSGYNEVPAVSTKASGYFKMRIDRQDATIAWELHYEGIETPVLQAHIHFGQHSVNGGISVFLCTNLGNGPAGTQACPAGQATLSGTITAVDVLGPGGQGLAASEFDELLAAMRSGVTYANVHSQQFPGGEIRGQIGKGEGGGHKH
ncbi:CHRD domain-containing protein [Aquabacterium humicola]|uniref:CHRD domain-containing protein n=1 Tax=Aquabacterium humicola TaxID=3237377 RepID=UPI002542DB39|nr:CHRD domain-containing protein [Rubrivivax pictus]